MNLTAALLLGGRSSRMGRDKALIEVGGQPLWWVQWQKLRALRPDRLIMSARDGQDAPVPPAPAVVVRDAAAEIGPLGGLIACLKAIQLDGPEALLLVLGVDLPRLPVALLQELVFSADCGCGVVVCHARGYEPLAAVYPPAMLDLARRRARLGHHALQGLVREGIERGLMDEVSLRGLGDWPDEVFLNLNTPEDVNNLRGL
ncbi:MAG: molybdenum cofactor guanylyltransferase [Verrucomicrobiales bacterium]